MMGERITVRSINEIRMRGTNQGNLLVFTVGWLGA